MRHYLFEALFPKPFATGGLLAAVERLHAGGAVPLQT
jgi:hypothetical protein